MYTLLFFILGATAVATSGCSVTNPSSNITYYGLSRNGIDIFLGIPYAHDTSGHNRFKPPVPFLPPPNSTITATDAGPACPQPPGQLFPPLALGNITHVSEDCLRLNIARPKNTAPTSKLPVMVWIHGGGFWFGSNTEPTTAPDHLVLQSVQNGSPMIHVAMNYRLGFFGYAQSGSLKAEGSENAGLRDQRLAIEWVRENIAAFGGDPENVTIFGQSSGGLAIGLQVLAYGGTKPLPFQRGIAESQALEPGITGTFTRDAMGAVVQYVGCNATCLDDADTIACLRSKDTDTLLAAAIATYASDIAHNVGDIWLPVVDDDFLPAAPSQLIAEGRVGNATFMSGWTQGDMNIYTDTTIKTANDTYTFMRAYLPALPEATLSTLLSMYPVAEYTPTKDLAAEFYRAARMFRDILMTCPSLLLGAAVHKTHPTALVYFYNFNQTILDPILAFTANVSGLGVVHTSEFAYVFDNLETYNVSGYPFHPTNADYELATRASRSWSSYAKVGAPSSSDPEHHQTVQGWDEAFKRAGGPWVMTIGGPHEVLSPLAGAEATAEMARQKLDERCGFLNSAEVIAGLQY